MATANLKLNLVTPAKKLLTDLAIDEVFVPADRGELNILPGHAPLVSTLTTGVLRFRKHGATELEQVAISWGYLEISHDAVTVLAETAETPADVDVERARAAEQQSLKALNKLDAAPEDIEKYRAKLERAIVRQAIAGGLKPEGR